MKKNYILIVILCISFALIAFFSVRLLTDLTEKKQGETYYAALPTPSVPETRKPTQTPASTTPRLSTREAPAEEEIAPEDETIPEAVWAPAVDFISMREEMPDLKGWITIEGTPVNYPIVQGADNGFYLSHLPDKEANSRGAIFLDYRCQPDFSSPNSLIYGHYSKTGDMFATLHSYREIDFYKEHPTYWIFTPEADYQIEIFAAYIVNSAYEVPPMTFASDDEFNSYITDIMSRTVFTADVTVTPEDRLISLATCEYTVGQGLGRIVVVGRIT